MALASLMICGQDRPYSLMVGDTAPQLAVSRWLQGAPVPAFEKGKVYVVDFFATWCVPCKKSMPALSALQRQFGESVTFIGVDVWDYQERVPQMLTDMSDRLSYRVALDTLPDIPKGEGNVPMWARENGQVSKAWLLASGADGIPTAFIVDQQGRICWIGNDVTVLQAQLKQVVGGHFDLSEATALYSKQAAYDKRIRDLDLELFKKRRAKDWEGAIRLCDELMSIGPELGRYAGLKFTILLERLNRLEDAKTFAHLQLSSRNPSANAFTEMALAFVRQKIELALAEQLANHAVDLAKGKKPGPYSALAEIAFARGEKAAAVRWQKKAISLTTDEDDLKEAQKRLADFGG
ncbi:MAG: TlpA family protein disulfide reductase [Armatimonadetes bacterium]|nr:TlpA family protein disulfide reductase [Armatimonadota bacterium]